MIFRVFLCAWFTRLVLDMMDEKRLHYGSQYGVCIWDHFTDLRVYCSLGILFWFYFHSLLGDCRSE